MSYFIENKFKLEIKNVVAKIFKNLYSDHKILIQKYLIGIMELICIKFNFNDHNKPLYYNQFRQNNYRDVKGIINILLPYINDPNYTKLGELKSLNDIYVKRAEGYENININEKEPKYEYSNIQYGRCTRHNGIAKEIAFNKSHLEHNYILLKYTIHRIANRLFVNWINIRPNIEGRNSRIFEETQKRINNGNMDYWKITNNESMEKYRGFSLELIYNVLTNDFYRKIKNIKWLIYDALIDNQVCPYIYIFNKLLPIESCVNDRGWNKLKRKERELFNLKFVQLINAGKNDDILKINYGIITRYYVKKIISAVFIFFQKYTDDTKELTKQNIKLTDISEIKDDDKKTIVAINEIFMIPIEYIYNFFYKSITQYKNTIFGKWSINYDGDKKMYMIDNFFHSKIDPIGTYYVTPKNIFNYSKSLSSDFVPDKNNPKKTVQVEYPPYWESLSTTLKDKIKDRINDISNDSEWFTITKNLERIFPNSLPNGRILLSTSIHGRIRSSIPNILMMFLATNGTYSTFIPEPALSDEKILPLEYQSKSEAIRLKLKDVISKYREYESIQYPMTYFLTGIQYRHMRPINMKKTNKGATFFDFLVDKDVRIDWYTLYAMDWISQIAFFHKYINSRIMYVTGSTGVGKSTQIPKLLLYALVIINHKSNAKIVATQPRIPPTTTVTERVSSELSVPIKEYNNDFKKDVITEYHYMQYEYKQDKHSKDTPMNIKIVTDGTLYVQLLNNPLLKKKIKKKNKYMYTEENIYDIVIVDEAHEHNANMDFILTMMKYTTRLNNDITLVIISATMDDDEPRYRRYYRDINDNMKYPLNTMLRDNNIDRVNVDRRLHISPPGQGTKFKVVDIYKSSDNDPIDIVKQIINMDNRGDILLFLPSSSKIAVAIERLNTEIPEGKNTIALAYYGNMSQDKKEFIESIDKNIKNIYWHRSVRHDLPFSKNNIKTVPKGTYSRAIIVATNLAEASITIHSLKYVVDTGTQYTGIYDYTLRNTKMELQNISESSRIQRRGRVGRTSPGTVYYLYKKGTMINNPTVFNLCIQDVKDNIYKFLVDNSNDNPILHDDPYDYTKNIDLHDLNKYDNGINNILKKQYFIGKYLFRHPKNQYNTVHYDYQNTVIKHNIHSTGFLYDSVYDRDGTFYLIHPDELNITRNILGKIIKVKENKGLELLNDGIIQSGKIDTFITMLEENLLLYIHEDKYSKTKHGQKLLDTHLTLKNDDFRDTMVFIFSNQYDCREEIAILQSMYETSPVLSDWCTTYIYKNKTLSHVNNVKMAFGDHNSDSMGFLNMGKRILGFLGINYSLEEDNIISSRYIRKVADYKKKYIEYVTNGTILQDFDDLTFTKFKKLDNKNKLDYISNTANKELDEIIKDDPYTDFNNKLLSDKQNNSLELYCRNQYLNFNTVKRFIKNFRYFKTKIYKHKKNLYDNDDDTTMFSEFDNILSGFKRIDNNISTSITRSLLHGYGYNIAIDISGMPIFLPIPNPSPENALQILRVGNSQQLNTLYKEKYIGEYILYLKIDDCNISLLHRVTPHMIQEHTINIYTPEKINKLKNIYFENKKSANELMELFKSSDISKNKKFTFGILNKIHYSINKIQYDLINNYVPVWDKLVNFIDAETKNNEIIHQLIIYNKNKQINELNNISQSGGAYIIKARKIYTNPLVKYISKKLINIQNTYYFH